MCRRVSCAQCGKPTFAGCGAHVEQVLAGVPLKDRCACREEAARSGAPPDKKPWWRFGR